MDLQASHTLLKWLGYVTIALKNSIRGPVLTMRLASTATAAPPRSYIEAKDL